MPAFIWVAAALLAAPAVTWSTANSVATGDQDAPSVAANRTGRVAVVWEDDRDTADPANNDHSEIFLRVFQDGTPAYELKLSGGGTAGTAWKHLTPDVAVDDRGTVVVVWADDPDGNGAFNVPYRVVSPTGAVLASGQANANATGNQIVPRVAVDPDGPPGNATAAAFTVVWEDVQGAAVTVKAAGFTGTATKAYERVVSQSTGTHHRPDVAAGASGDATIVWEGDADGDASYDVGITRLSRTGTVLSAPATATSASGGQQMRPAVAANYAGDVTLAWESNHTGAYGVWFRSFTATGTARHADAQVAAAAAGSAPTVGVDDRGEVVAGWTAGGVDGRIRGFNADGTTVGRLPEQTLTATTTGRQDQYAVAVSPWGEIAIAYTDDSDGNLFDQVLLGTGAVNSDPGGWLARKNAIRAQRPELRDSSLPLTGSSRPHGFLVR